MLPIYRKGLLRRSASGANAGLPRRSAFGAKAGLPRRSAVGAKAGATLLLCAVVAGGAVALSAETPQQAYTRALGRERTLREATSTPSLAQIRAVMDAYVTLARKHPSSGYSDNALWQAANLAVLAHERYGQLQDRKTALRLLDQLKQQYPSSSLVARVNEVASRLTAAPATDPPAAPAPPPLPVTERVGPPSPDVLADSAAPKPLTEAAAPKPDAAAVIALRDIKRTPLPGGMRVTLELDGEASYRAERLENPRRVFFDFRNVKAVAPLQDATLRFADDVVREIRLGRHPNATRVVIDMRGVDTYSVFTLYEPFRVVIDLQRTTAAPAAPPTPPAVVTTAPPAPEPKAPASVPIARPADLPLPRLAPPSAPSTNSNGQFSLSRQLGLGISRIVIDAGHGGHDPGARANGVNEAELVLDVALRLSRLLQKQGGFEVVMTRDRDVFIPLEERTAIANREGADLFLSIHANASRTGRARGIETYFLNFATNPEAEAVAARENAGSAKTMHNLPEIVRAIALNNKIDESRDLAGIVQKSMIRRLAVRNRSVKDLGVKQAPFVVLIGALMPSILAEISFVTHKQEAQLLKTPAYRQHIAEALLDGVLKYQQSLKRQRAVASQATGNR